MLAADGALAQAGPRFETKRGNGLITKRSGVVAV